MCIRDSSRASGLRPLVTQAVGITSASAPRSTNAREIVGSRPSAQISTPSTPILVWTVDGPQRLRTYLADGRVAGIITDLPGLAVETRRELLSGVIREGTKVRRGPASGGADDFMPAHVTGPVSYTHLDVYKRQA